MQGAEVRPVDVPTGPQAAVDYLEANGFSNVEITRDGSGVQITATDPSGKPFEVSANLSDTGAFADAVKQGLQGGEIAGGFPLPNDQPSTQPDFGW